MKVEIENSFERDAKKIPDSVLDELKTIYVILEEAQTLGDLAYSIKKMQGSRKIKAFRLRLSQHSDFRIGFYLKDDTVVLSRILNRKDIYKKFPPKK
jgi:mRNA interferase RelE/StbE